MKKGKLHIQACTRFIKWHTRQANSR